MSWISRIKDFFDSYNREEYEERVKIRLLELRKDNLNSSEIDELSIRRRKREIRNNAKNKDIEYVQQVLEFVKEEI